MHTLDPQKTGLALGGFMAVLHVSWALLVALGLAQPLISFILKMHMMTPFVTVLPFNLGSAIMLVILTGIIGFIAGLVFATIWNNVVKMK